MCPKTLLGMVNCPELQLGVYSYFCNLASAKSQRSFEGLAKAIQNSFNFILQLKLEAINCIGLAKAIQTSFNFILQLKLEAINCALKHCSALQTPLPYHQAISLLASPRFQSQPYTGRMRIDRDEASGSFSLFLY